MVSNKIVISMVVIALLLLGISLIINMVSIEPNVESKINIIKKIKEPTGNPQGNVNLVVYLPANTPS